MNRSEVEIFNSVIRHCLFLDSSLYPNKTNPLEVIHRRVHAIWTRNYRYYSSKSEQLTPQTIESILLTADQNDKTYYD